MRNPEQIETRSLELFAQRLVQTSYPGYPKPEERYWQSTDDLPTDPGERLIIPPGPWWTNEARELNDRCNPADYPTVTNFDSNGRPLHPWFKNMLTNKNLGIVAGRGFYYDYGPNYTGDPIIFRHDLDEVHVLLIERRDRTGLALPGGHFDKRYDTTGIDTARREAKEETGIDITNGTLKESTVYIGPVADIRTTIHSWPETTAVRFDLSNDFARTLGTASFKGFDDALAVHWVPVSQKDRELFGSHNLLVDLALEQEA